MENMHTPVLLQQVMHYLAPRAGETYVDATFGAGGYSRAILQAGAHVIGIDRDPSAVEAAFADPNLTVKLGKFGDMADMVDQPVDGVVFDLGVSSMQIDNPKRGFSFQKDGPLDMRMGSSGRSAFDIVNKTRIDALADIIFHYGDERSARRIARQIADSRPVHTTGQLADIVHRCFPRPKPGQIDSATRTFQAIRIAVNDELGQLEKGLEASAKLLKPGGRLVVVSFHSLEDRIVKRFLQGEPGQSRHLPQAATNARVLEILTKKPVHADEAEIAVNPRSRSAILRAGVKI
ncbi:MAG: 16S rRNA (cytosine(1402)-N(4))-methyltransferase RsmH [Alphaproteobacteria bacterium]|nr:16S rRNA (cytosine(1402)-N(4))-methyltransferase RsmH [Alphaproteobacteria bacterium]